MSQLKYQISLSSDNKYSVSVQSDDPLSLKQALPWVKKIQERLVELVEPEQTQAVPSTPKQSPLPPVEAQPETPRCGVHSTPMVSVQGQHGSFWSCHQRNGDGTWCTYKPRPRTAVVNAIHFPVPQL